MILIFIEFSPPETVNVLKVILMGAKNKHCLSVVKADDISLLTTDFRFGLGTSMEKNILPFTDPKG